MKTVLKRVLATTGRMMLSRQFESLNVGSGSEVYFWRLRGASGATLQVGEKSRVETRIAFERPGGRISIGNRSFVGLGYISCASRIEIGDDVMIAWNTAIFDHGSHSIRFRERARDVENWLQGKKDWSVVDSAPVIVGSKSWIGYASIVFPGVQIGEGAVVGAGSVVTRSVPPWTIVAGNPARVIRELSDDER